jgi:hypothetical protein
VHPGVTNQRGQSHRLKQINGNGGRRVTGVRLYGYLDATSRLQSITAPGNVLTTNVAYYNKCRRRTPPADPERQSPPQGTAFIRSTSTCTTPSATSRPGPRPERSGFQTARIRLPARRETLLSAFSRRCGFNDMRPSVMTRLPWKAVEDYSTPRTGVLHELRARRLQAPVALRTLGKTARFWSYSVGSCRGRRLNRFGSSLYTSHGFAFEKRTVLAPAPGRMLIAREYRWFSLADSLHRLAMSLRPSGTVRLPPREFDERGSEDRCV